MRLSLRFRRKAPTDPVSTFRRHASMDITASTAGSDHNVPPLKKILGRLRSGLSAARTWLDYKGYVLNVRQNGSINGDQMVMDDLDATAHRPDPHEDADGIPEVDHAINAHAGKVKLRQLPRRPNVVPAKSQACLSRANIGANAHDGRTSCQTELTLSA